MLQLRMGSPGMVRADRPVGHFSCPQNWAIALSCSIPRGNPGFSPSLRSFLIFQQRHYFWDGDAKKCKNCNILSCSTSLCCWRLCAHAEDNQITMAEQNPHDRPSTAHLTQWTSFHPAGVVLVSHQREVRPHLKRVQEVVQRGSGLVVWNW